MSSDADARALLVQAEKKATQSSFFSSPKHDQAAELYTRAASIFKIAKCWRDAGDALIKAAHQHILAGDRDDASPVFANAAKCYKKGFPEEAVGALRQSVEILTDSGRFHQAANQMKEIAGIYETDMSDVAQAMKAYETAADWYTGEEANALAGACLVKVATYAAQLEQYDRAVTVFEKVAAHSLESQLTRYSVKEYFFKAGLCHLCTGDSVGTHRALERYNDLDPSFSSTRECQFLKLLTDAVDNGDVDQFTTHVIDFDNLSKLDPWKTTMLLRVKRSIGEEPELT